MKQQLDMTCIDYGVATRTKTGESACGDLHLVKQFDAGVLLAVIDGLGHGTEAAKAAQMAATLLERHASEPLGPLIERCHKGLTGTRGVALTTVSIRTSGNTLSWIGVGNVCGCLIRGDARTEPRTEEILLRGGIVGFQLPPLRMGMRAIAPGDWLLLATDGVSAGFTEDLNIKLTPQAMAQRILSRHSKPTDDALVLAARYTGES
jgi:phosphoserine phosphatase RsbX